MSTSLIIGIALIGFAFFVLCLLMPGMVREMDEKNLAYDCGYRDGYRQQGCVRQFPTAHETMAYEQGQHDGFARRERDDLRM